jgi:hypothetical protein
LYISRRPARKHLHSAVLLMTEDTEQVYSSYSAHFRERAAEDTPSSRRDIVLVLEKSGEG